MKNLIYATLILAFAMAAPSLSYAQRPKPQDRRESPEIAQLTASMQEAYSKSGVNGLSKWIVDSVKQIPVRESTEGLQKRREFLEGFIDFAQTPDGQRFLQTINAIDYQIIVSKLGEFMDSAKRAGTIEDQKKDFIDALAGAWITGPSICVDVIRKFFLISNQASLLYPEDTYLAKASSRMTEIAESYAQQRVSTKGFNGLSMKQKLAYDFLQLQKAGKVEMGNIEYLQVKTTWVNSMTDGTTPFSYRKAASNTFSGAIIQTMLEKSGMGSAHETFVWVTDFLNRIESSVHLTGPMNPPREGNDGGANIFDSLYFSFRLSPEGTKFELQYSDLRARSSALKQYFAEAYLTFIGTREGQRFLSELTAQEFYRITKIMMKPDMYRTIPKKETDLISLNVETAPDEQMKDLFVRSAESFSNLEAVSLGDIRKFFILNDLAGGQEDAVIYKLNDAMITGLLLNDTGARSITKNGIRDYLVGMLEASAKDGQKFGFGELDGIRYFTNQKLPPYLQLAYNREVTEYNQSPLAKLKSLADRIRDGASAICYGLARKANPKN